MNMRPIDLTAMLCYSESGIITRQTFPSGANYLPFRLILFILFWISLFLCVIKQCHVDLEPAGAPIHISAPSVSLLFLSLSSFTLSPSLED